MKGCKKSPGMRSDRPGITPKSLDLVISPTCLREKGKEFLVGLSRVGGERESDIHIYVKSGRSHLSLHSRTVRDARANRPPLKISN